MDQNTATFAGCASVFKEIILKEMQGTVQHVVCVLAKKDCTVHGAITAHNADFDALTNIQKRRDAVDFVGGIAKTNIIMLTLTMISPGFVVIAE